MGETVCFEGLVGGGAAAVDCAGVVSFDFKACFGLPASSVVPTATPPAPWDNGPSFLGLSFSPILPLAGTGWLCACGLAS